MAVSRIVFAIAVLFILDYLFALILLVSGIAIFILTKFLRKKNKKLQSEIQKSEVETLGFYKESFDNMDVLKVFNNKDKVKAKESDVNDRYLNRNLKKDNFNLAVNSGFLTVMRFSFLFGIVWCAFRYNQGITLGSLIAIVQLVSQITIPFTSLSGVLPTYYSCLASIDRISEVVDLKKEEKKKNISFEFLEAKNVSYSYDKYPVLKKINLFIKKGEFIVINGSSGKGKTTLVKLMMGLFSPDEGTVSINDEIEVEDVSNLFAYLPQRNMILSGTIRENLTYFSDYVTDDDIDKAIELACLKKEIDLLPNGVETKLSDYGEGLSEGQLQRLSIARVVIAKRQIIVLDEATSSLDSKTEEKLLKNLKDLNVTTIFISHKNRTLSFADRVLTIEGGKIING